MVLHEERPLARSLAHEVTCWLEDRGHDVRLTIDDAALVGAGTGVDPGDFGQGLDLAVSLGGDGTMLRTVHLVAAHDVDILGVNLGHMGYLTEVEPSELISALERFFDGQFGVERRMMLVATVHVGGATEPSATHHVLNEAVVEKTAAGHTVRLAVALDGDEFTTYAADGLIVATPTGSTAYSFSARGPIVDPTHRALVLTPVAPHMLFDRSMVLDPATEVVLTVRDHRWASLAVDGRLIGVLGDGDVVRCRASDHEARLVTFGPREFHRILKAKFGLNDR